MLCAILVTLVNPDQPLTLAEVENRLTRNGYTESLIETGWAIQKGKAIVPILDKMLSNAKKYSDIGEFTGAFPFNAEYVLAHIGVPESLAALKKHKLKFGIQGWNLRHTKKSQNYGVVRKTVGLHPQASSKIGSVLIVKPGESVKILKRRVENAREEGPRGGASLFDEVEVLSSGRRGYVQRAGDDFDPFM